MWVIPVLRSIAHKTLQERSEEILKQIKVFSVNPFYSLTFEVVETMLTQGQTITQQSIWSRIVAVDSSYSVSELEQVYSYNESRPMYWCDLLRKYKLAREAIKLINKTK